MEQEFCLSDDISFQPFNEVLSTDGSIKREDLKDDDDMLLFAQLDSLSNNLAANSNDFPIASSVDVVDHPADQAQQGTVVKDGLQEQFNNKMVMNLDKLSQVAAPGIDVGNPDSLNLNTSHFVRYKLQDGRHIKIWECGICSKEFTHQYTLMRHLPTHTDERKFQCNTCGKAFRQMSTLSQHRAIHSTERPYICEICQKTFNRVSTLISHRKTHTGLKPHKCHLCTKAFHQKGNLRNHIFTHTNERPYKCDLCDKGFNQMSNLMCHKLKAHQRTEKPKYICQICNQCFPKRMTLRQHEQYTHGMIAENIGTPQTPEKLNLMNAIIVDPIKTEAMRLALESDQTPFALLRPLSGIPVLVRVMPAGGKQMLVPATADDLKKHSHISITNKGDKENTGPVNPATKSNGSTVQIKIPVVATVIQQNDNAGQMSMSVVSPGPNEFISQPSLEHSFGNANFTYTSSLINNQPLADAVMNIQNMTVNNGFVTAENNFVSSTMINNAEIEFFDGSGRPLGEQKNFTDINFSSAINAIDNIEDASNKVEKSGSEISTIDLTNPTDNNNITDMDIEQNLF